MNSRVTPSRHTRATAAWAVLLLAAISPAPAETGFTERFLDDPVTTGRFRVHDGDPARFVYDPAEHMLRAHCDSLLPTARLIRPLCRPLTHADSFEFAVVFRIRSEGYSLNTALLGAISFGLMNTATTGTDRDNGFDGNGAFEVVSFDYYPNALSSWPGPSGGATLINRDIGIGFANRRTINFEFGPETEILARDDEQALERDQWLTAQVRYDGLRRLAHLRVLHDGQALNINRVGKSFAEGGTDGDPTTITTRLTGAGFTVDSFGILLWRQTDMFGVPINSLAAQVDFRSVAVSWSAAGDMDDSGWIDHVDLARFMECVTGPRVPPQNEPCRAADLDCDSDVDQEDFGLLQAGLGALP